MKYLILACLLTFPAYAMDINYGDGGAAQADRMYQQQKMDNMREEMQQQQFRQEQAMRDQREQFQRQAEDQRDRFNAMSPADRMNYGRGF